VSFLSFSQKISLILLVYSQYCDTKALFSNDLESLNSLRSLFFVTANRQLKNDNINSELNLFVMVTITLVSSE